MKITQILSLTAAGALVVGGGVTAFRTAHAEEAASPTPAAQAAQPHKGGCHGFGGCKAGDHGPMARWHHFRHGGPGCEGKGHDFGPGKMLSLTADQKQKVKAVFVSVKPQIEAIRKEEAAKIQSVMSDARKQIRPILTDSQQKVFDDMEQLRTDKAALTPAPAASPAPAQ